MRNFEDLAADLESQPITGWLHTGEHISIPLISHITDNLYVGGHSAEADLGDFFTHVFSFYVFEDPYKTAESVYHEGFHMYDSPGYPDLDTLDDAVPKIVAALEAGGNVLVHCFLPGTMVGAKTPVEIEKAEVVLSHDGTFNNVIENKVDWYKGSTVNIETSGALPMSCTPEHPFLVVRPYVFPGGIKAKPGVKSWQRVSTVKKHYEDWPKWLPASDLQEGDYLVVPRPVFDSEPREMEFINSEHPKSKQILPLQPDAETAWMLGLYAADGSTMGDYAISFTLAAGQDYARLESVFAALGVQTKTTHFDTYSRVTVASKTIASHFREWFGLGAQRRLPEFVFDNGFPLDALLEGYVYGDGYSDNRGRVTCHTISKVLVEQIRMIALSVGYVPHVSFARRHSGYENSQQGYHIYWHTSPRHNIHAMMGGQILLPIRSISEGYYEGEVYNLSVENTETFTVNGVATHNCQAGINRSNLAAVLVLMQWKGLTAAEAIAMLRERRSPSVLANQSFYNYLMSLDKETSA